jgi:hypothetical protein
MRAFRTPPQVAPDGQSSQPAQMPRHQPLAPLNAQVVEFPHGLLDFCTGQAVSTRSFKKPPGAAPIEVSFRPGGAGNPNAAGDVR